MAERSPIISGTVFSKLIFRVLKEITQHLDHHVHDLLSRQFELLINNPYFKNITKNN